MASVENIARWVWDTSIAGSVLIVITLTVGVMLRRSDFAPMRHLLGLLVVARLLWPVALPSPWSVFNLVRREEPAPVAVAPSAIPLAQASTIEFRTTLEAKPKLPWLSIAWAVGVVLVLRHVGRQHARVRQWVKDGERVCAGVAANALVKAKEECGCKRAIGVWAVKEMSSPALFGFWKPKIVLPSRLIAEPDANQLRLIFLHELAHLRRMDVLVNWLMIFAQALHWFNPLVWLAMRRLRAEQELLCDADVLRVLRPEEHRSYGETLLALATGSTARLSTVIPISSNFKQLKERIGVIAKFKTSKRRMVMIVAPGLAAILAVATFTAAAEKKPTKPRPSAQEIAATEKEKKKIEEIGKLERILAEQSDRVMAAEQWVDELRKRLNIAPFRDEFELYASGVETATQLKKDLRLAEKEYVQFKTLRDSLHNKSRKELVQMLPTAYRDSLMDGLLQDLMKAEQQLAVLRTNFADDHPDVMKLAAMCKLTEKQIDERATGILAGLETLVKAREAILKTLKEQVDQSRETDSLTLDKARPYFRALRELETQRRLRDSITIRITQEKLDGNLAVR